MTSASAEKSPSLDLSKVATYDPVGNPLLIEDGEGHPFELQYDELGRRIQARGPIGFPDEETTTAFTYDPLGRLLAKTEAVGQAEERSTELRYDPLGRLVEATDPLGRKSYLGYDEMGNLVESVNAAGERLRYRHDKRGLLLERTGPGIADTYAYDGFGRQVLSSNGEATRRFEYDALDRAIAVWDSHFGTARRVYDADGRITQAVYPDAATYGFPEGVGVTYLHDARNQVVSIVDPVAGAWQLDYDALGRLIHRTDPYGFERFIRYTPEGFVDRVTLEDSSGEIEEFVYADYDALGNPHTITSGEGTTTIAYDARSRVTSVDYPGTESESFGYDRLGNRTSQTDRSGASFTYEYDPADQLLAILDQATQQTTASFTYDGAGRRATRTAGGETSQYGYDALGRLTELTRPGYSMALGYDPEGSRYRRSETGELDALFFGEWVERRGGETVRLTHGPGIDNVIAEVTAGGAVRTLMRNGTANVSHVAVDGTLEPTSRRYEAFGALRSGSSVVERGFAGRPPEGMSGLLNLRARHYDPATGTFLQPDPLGVEATQLYAYAESNPYVYADPAGLSSWSMTSTQIGMSWSLTGGAPPLADPWGLFAGNDDLAWVDAYSELNNDPGDPGSAAWAAGGAGALVLTTRRLAGHQAMDQAGIPRSQQPSAQWTIHDPSEVKGPGVRDPNPANQGWIREYEVQTPRGTEYRYIAEHPYDPSHGGTGHYHTGEPKPGSTRVLPGERFRNTGPRIPFRVVPRRMRVPIRLRGTGALLGPLGILWDAFMMALDAQDAAEECVFPYCT